MRRPTAARLAATAAALLLIGAGGFHGVVFLVDEEPWAGPVGWRKAITFGFSLGVILLSFAVLARFVRLGRRGEQWVLGALARRASGSERMQRRAVVLAAGIWSAVLLAQGLLAIAGRGPV
jgi:hypothetical protein